MKKSRRILCFVYVLILTAFMLLSYGKKESFYSEQTEPSCTRSIDETKYESKTELETEFKTELKTEYADKTEKATEKEESKASKPENKTTETKTENNTLKPETTVPKRTPNAAANFFDDAVLVGDSVSLGLRNYVTSRRNGGNECLGSAQFLVAGSMGYCNSRGKIGSPDSIHPKYKGKEVTIEDGVALTGAKKVFIMLGLNDFCAYSLDESMKNVKKTVNGIKEKNPDVKIYIQSVTPVIKSKERGRFNNDSINAFNSALEKTANELGCEFVDIAPIMKNSDGCFKDEYCSDPDAQGVHMNSAGSKVWVEYLTQQFAQEGNGKKKPISILHR